MTKILIGFILGVVVSTIGFGGVDTVKTQAQDLAR